MGKNSLGLIYFDEFISRFGFDGGIVGSGPVPGHCILVTFS